MKNEIDEDDEQYCANFERRDPNDEEEAALLVDDRDEPVDVLGAELAKIIEDECMRLAEMRQAEEGEDALERVMSSSKGSGAKGKGKTGGHGKAGKKGLHIHTHTCPIPSFAPT